MNDGGPAFPCEGVSSTEIGKEGIQMISRLPSNGMFLRDWFAGKALRGCQHIMRTEDDYFTSDTTEVISKMAYALADAMLKERKK